MPQQTFLFKQHGIQFYISLFSSFLSFFKCISFRPPVHQRCNSLPTTSLFTTVQSDDDSWLDAGTKQFFDPAAGGSTHSSPLSEADLTYSPPLPCSWSPPLSEAGLPYSSPPPAVDRLPFSVGLPRSSPPLAADLLYLPSFRTLLFSSKPPLPSAARRYPVLPQLPQQCSYSSHSSAPPAPTAPTAPLAAPRQPEAATASEQQQPVDHTNNSKVI